MINVIGYVVINGHYQNKHYFEGSYEKIIAFILMHPYDEIVITDDYDCLILSAKQTFIDICAVDDTLLFYRIYSQYLNNTARHTELKFQREGTNMVEK